MIMRVLIGIVLVLMTLYSKAQDVHFSMFDLSPLNLNPANTGNFNGDYRLAAIHRNQWRSVTVPFVTTSISGDAVAPFRGLQNLHVGLMMLSDKAGDSKFSTFKLNPSVAYHHYLTKDSSQTVRVAIQSGFTNRSINFDQLRFDSQYNGYVYDDNLNSGETFYRNSRFYGDLNLGAQYQIKLDSTKTFDVGVSWFNIAKPKQSFNDLAGVKLDRRFVLQLGGTYVLNSKITLLPGFIFMPQGKYREFLIGSNLKYRVQNSPLKADAIYVGAWIRTRDAYYFTFGADYKHIHARVSYDFNYSNFVPATNRRGALELGLIYIHKNIRSKHVKYKRCPDYM